MLLFALTTVAQPVYYTLVCVFMSQSALPSPRLPPPAPTPLKHWKFVCMLSSLFVFEPWEGGRWAVRRTEASGVLWRWKHRCHYQVNGFWVFVPPNGFFLIIFFGGVWVTFPLPAAHTWREPHPVFNDSVK